MSDSDDNMSDSDDNVSDSDDNMSDSDDIVLALVPRSQAEYLAAASALESAEIPFIAKNAGVQSLFGAGTIGTGYNLLTGPIEIWVHPDDLEAVHQVLEEIRLPPDLEVLDSEDSDESLP